MQKIVGRTKEQNELEEAYASTRPEFIALYGRRRVGKTFLVRNTFGKKKDAAFLYVTGKKNGSLASQLKHVAKEIGNTFIRPGVEVAVKKSWDDMLEFLTNEIKQSTKKKIVLFFDEFPWMVTRKSGLLEALDLYWNHTWSRDPRIKLIVCGSSASWILTHIINDTGGFHNRVTRRMHLRPFTLSQTKEYLRYRKIILNNRQIAHLYMALGGIPHYLDQIKPGFSAVQIIEQLAFDKDSFLVSEFDNLYATLFGAGGGHVELARLIALHPQGIGQEELTRKASSHMSPSSVPAKLKDLVDADFIDKFKPYKHTAKGIYYKMVDEYSIFYFHWLESLRDTLLDRGMTKGYWEKLQSSPSWHTWAGYAFESLCYKHIPQISAALNLSPTALPYTWRYAPRPGSEERGAQIDLLFDRDDGVITVCEIKYTTEPFVLDKKYAEQLQRKIDVFNAKTKTTKDIFIALISASGLKRTVHTIDMLSAIATLDDLFL